MRTRFWSSDEGSSTCVQVRDDTSPTVWMNTNLGWIQIGNSPTTYEEGEKFAETLADGYGLEERSVFVARRMAGVVDGPETFEEEEDESCDSLH